MEVKIQECTDPSFCSLCVRACPAKVLLLKPTGTRTMSDYVERWRVRPVFTGLCNGCRRCEEVCPEGKIRVVL
jgi:ferredoxin